MLAISDFIQRRPQQASKRRVVSHILCVGGEDVAHYTENLSRQQTQAKETAGSNWRSQGDGWIRVAKPRRQLDQTGEAEEPAGSDWES